MMEELLIGTMWSLAAGFIGYWIGFLSRNKEVTMVERQRDRLYRYSNQLAEANRDFDRELNRMRHAG